MLESLTRNEGKPEQAIPKIVEGRLNGFFKDACLLEQPFVKDQKQTIQQLLGDGHRHPLRPGSRSASSRVPDGQAAVVAGAC